MSARNRGRTGAIKAAATAMGALALTGFAQEPRSVPLDQVAPPPPFVTAPGAPPPSPSPPPPRPSVITGPPWIRKPNGDDLMRAYPPAALKHGEDGHTTIDCAVTDIGTLANCSVVEETPAGEGFGEAALKLAPRYKMRATTVDGAPVGGARVRIPVTWRVAE